MVEKSRLSVWIAHSVLILGILAIALPIYVAFVASTHDVRTVAQAPMPLVPGPHLWENYARALGQGSDSVGNVPVAAMLANSFIMAMVIATAKIVISLLSAFAIVYFRFPFRMGFFWMIFITLMLPVEVRIVPTYEVVANALAPVQSLLNATGLTWLIERLAGLRVSLEWNMLDTYAGLTVPLVASATATFLFRQVFLTMPDEMTEAARIDGAGPVRFLFDILLPLSRTNIAALFVILFIYGWNQYLWPLLVSSNLLTVQIGIGRMLAVGDGQVDWPIVMASTMLAMIPPVIVVVAMQRAFIKGLVETEK